MPLPSPPDANEDLDPLAEFLEESAPAAPAEIVEPVEPAPPAALVEADVPAAVDHPVVPVPQIDPERLTIAESDIERLRADMATLVTAVDDITRRLNRRPEPAPAPPRLRAVPPRLPARAALVAVIAGLALGVLTWQAVTSVDVPEPPPIAAEAQPEPEPDPPLSMATPRISAEPVAAMQTVDAVGAAPVRDVPARAVARRTFVGSLTIDADPGGDVFLNRKHVGRTPLRLNQLRAGSHLVWIERDGYRRWTRVVQVPADRISRVSAELEALTAR